MADMPLGNGVASSEKEPWFDYARDIDPEWIELRVTTKDGEHVYYRIPRRTFFQEIDEVTSSMA